MLRQFNIYCIAMQHDSPQNAQSNFVLQNFNLRASTASFPPSDNRVVDPWNLMRKLNLETKKRSTAGKRKRQGPDLTMAPEV